MQIIDSARNEKATTEWLLTDDGRLKEVGKDSYTFTLSRNDTATLFKLLARNADLILAGLHVSVHQDKELP